MKVKIFFLCVIVVLLGAEVLVQGMVKVNAGDKDYISVKELGAYGDGLHDDTKCIQEAIDYAEKEKKTLVFEYGEYLISSTIFFKNISVVGNGAIIKSTKINEWIVSKPDAMVAIYGEDENTISTYISNLEFQIDNDLSTYIFEISNAKNCKIIDCKFVVLSKEKKHNLLSMDWNYENIQIESCEFLANNNAESGCCIMIRNQKDILCQNISVKDCYFIGDSGDELLAVWGWLGCVKDIYISNCEFIVEKDENPPKHIIALGICGETENVLFEKNRIYAECFEDTVIKVEQSNTDTITVNEGINKTENIFINNNVISVGDCINNRIGALIQGINTLQGEELRNVVIQNNNIEIVGNNFSKAIIMGVNFAIGNIIRDVKNKGNVFYNCKYVENNIVEISEKSQMRLCANCENIIGNTFVYAVNNISDSIAVQYYSQTGNVEQYVLRDNNFIYRGNGKQPLIFANYSEGIADCNFLISGNYFERFSIYINNIKEYVEENNNYILMEKCVINTR